MDLRGVSGGTGGGALRDLLLCAVWACRPPAAYLGFRKVMSSRRSTSLPRGEEAAELNELVGESHCRPHRSPGSDIGGAARQGEEKAPSPSPPPPTASGARESRLCGADAGRSVRGERPSEPLLPEPRCRSKWACHKRKGYRAM